MDLLTIKQLRMSYFTLSFAPPCNIAVVSKQFPNRRNALLGESGLVDGPWPSLFGTTINNHFFYLKKDYFYFMRPPFKVPRTFYHRGRRMWTVCSFKFLTFTWVSLLTVSGAERDLQRVANLGAHLKNYKKKHIPKMQEIILRKYPNMYFKHYRTTQRPLIIWKNASDKRLRYVKKQKKMGTAQLKTNDGVETQV